MDHAAYHVIYVDTRVSQALDGERIKDCGTNRSEGAKTLYEGSREDQLPECLTSISEELDEIQSNIQSLLAVFHEVHICTSGTRCMTDIQSLKILGHKTPPVIVILGIDSEIESSATEASQESVISPTPFSLHGLSLLRHISGETSDGEPSMIVIPVTMIYSLNAETSHSPPSALRSTWSPTGVISNRTWDKNSSPELAVIQRATLDSQQVQQSIDFGAQDVLTSPLQEDRLQILKIHANKQYKDMLRARTQRIALSNSRKLSRFEHSDSKPYAYLRERMVSELMTGICNPDEILHTVDFRKLPDIGAQRARLLREAIGSWNYSGHDYSEDELVHAAQFMIQHALEAPELERWRLSAVDLKTFLMASRAAYNGFVSYHNFRHVVDVMQAIFYFLIQIGTLPVYPASSISCVIPRNSSPIAALLRPFDALTLLVTAIGHDVGHPGVNNAFLVALNTPLAQLYNDKSVLEAFHCAAYSQILRRFWKAAFEDVSMRGLMINSILATDMGVHGKYMSELGNLQERLHHNKGTDGWSPQTLDEYRVLTCALLVKCADISNVARPFAIAEQWATVLQLEFAKQGMMEKAVGIATTLFGGPPELGNIVKLGNSQNSFINMFARPLFEAVADLMPAMDFAVNEMKLNQDVWARKIKIEAAKQSVQSNEIDQPLDGQMSPRSASPNRSTSQPELSHPEGLPASTQSSRPLSKSPRPPGAETQEQRRMSASSLPHRLGSNDSTQDTSRRSSLGNPLSQIASNPDSAASYSRRSSGAFSAANTPHSAFTTRRTNNISPSQLQLGSDSKTHRRPSLPISENKQPNGRASEDTLSQAPFAKPLVATSASRRGSMASGGAGDLSRRSSRGDAAENMRFNLGSGNQTSGRPYAYSGHHRSSSGAHTTNTNISQSTPYSPTGTQATSVLTNDSDEKGSPERCGSWKDPECCALPKIPNLERPGSGHGFTSRAEQDPAGDAKLVKTIVYGNGNIREVLTAPRIVGRKGSRFNFSFFKRRGKGVEASP